VHLTVFLGEISVRARDVFVPILGVSPGPFQTLPVSSVGSYHGGLKLNLGVLSHQKVLLTIYFYYL
jgi:hypothetical protein